MPNTDFDYPQSVRHLVLNELTVPKPARLRRKHPEWIMIHRADLAEQEVSQHEGIPVTTVERSITDVLSTTHRTDIARKAITDALRAGLLNSAQAGSLRKLVNRSAHSVSSLTDGRTAKVGHESTAH